MKTVVGMFTDVSEAQRSFEDLVGIGFGPNDISVVTALPTEERGHGRMKLFAVEAPDTGKVAACGPLSTMLAGNQAGLMATLQNAGVAPKLAEHYVNAVRQGATLESVLVEDKDAERVVEIMKRHAARYGDIEHSMEERHVEPEQRYVEPEQRHVEPASGATVPTSNVKPFSKGNGEEISSAAGATAAATTQPRATVAPSAAASSLETSSQLSTGSKRAKRPFEGQEDYVIPILREEIQIGKREVERGGLHVDVHVVERPISEHVILREEHVEIERHPIDRVPTPEESVFKDGQLELTELGEEVVVSKQVRVVEEVRLRKCVLEHEEVVNDSLRSTTVDIDPHAFEHKAYRSHFDSLGQKGEFDEAVPAYDFGRDLRKSPTERWEDIEEDARVRWETQKPGTWERFRDAIYYAWSRARLH